MWWKIGPPFPRFSDPEPVCIRQWHIEINALHRVGGGIRFSMIEIVEPHSGCEHIRVRSCLDLRFGPTELISVCIKRNHKNDILKVEKLLIVPGDACVSLSCKWHPQPIKYEPWTFGLAWTNSFNSSLQLTACSSGMTSLITTLPLLLILSNSSLLKLFKSANLTCGIYLKAGYLY